MDDYLSYKIPNILYLDGIRFSDYEPLEDKSDKKILENIDFPTLNIAKQSITDTICCLNCTFCVGDDPIFIPTCIKKNTDGDLILNYGHKGHMCSYNCAMRIIIEITNDRTQERWKYINNLQLLYYIKNGIYIYDIKPAPSRNLLIKYGGHLTNEEFLLELKKIQNMNSTNIIYKKNIINDIKYINNYANDDVDEYLDELIFLC